MERIKKRVFIAIHYMEIGGAESSLVGLLQSFDYQIVDVDLFVYSHRGELMQFIPEQVNLLPEIPEYTQIESPLRQVFRDGYWKIGLARIKAKVQFRLYCMRKRVKESAAGFQYDGDAVAPFLPFLFYLGEYDLAISYLNPHNIVRDKVKAKKKIAWIHTDYGRVDVNVKKELIIWAAYDYVISISPDVTKSFLDKFPALAPKIVEMENIISPSFIRKRASEVSVSGEMVNDGIRILSIGRFAYAKNFDNVPDICSRMIKKGFCSFKWYIIGYGQEEALIRQNIVQSGMQDYVVLLGKKSNPYPYIRDCDVYVQPSRYEGKSIAVREAQILCKPVIITNYPTAMSQIQDGRDGIIVPIDNESCADGVVRFLNNVEKQEEIIAYLKAHDFGNESAIITLYSLM